MTLFDVIRYPISNPPTKEELDAVPRLVYNEWREWIGHRLTPFGMSVWLTNPEHNEDQLRYALSRLRWMLQEME